MSYKKKNHSALIRYTGSKNQIAEKIINLFPAHEHYVEVFGGGGAVLFNKSRSNKETINDYNSSITCLFACLRDDSLFQRFMIRLNNTIMSRETWQDARDTLRDNDLRMCDMTDEQILFYGWSAYVAYNLSIGGKVSMTSGGFSTTAGGSWRSGIASLDKIRDRLHQVIVYNADFEDVITYMDSDNTLFYLDPPYTEDTRDAGIYVVESDILDQYRLMRSVLTHHNSKTGKREDNKGMFIISGYDNEMYNRILCNGRGWNKYTFATKTGLSVVSQDTMSYREEVVWCSPNIARSQLSLFDH